MVESAPKCVENSVEKGEIARNEHFLLFPQSFHKTRTVDAMKTGACLFRSS